MGTRNLTCVVKDGVHKVAQYCQWDGYPEGQGVSILEFLRNGDLAKLKENIERCTFISQEEYERLYNEFPETAKDMFFKLYPQFSRDTGPKILTIIAELEDDGKPFVLYDEYKFAGDSLFCEWAYVIDFDKNTFEVYEGFNKSPLDEGERFYGVETPTYENLNEKFYPVRLSKEFQLRNLPDKEVFIAAFEEDEDNQQEAM